MANLSRRRRIEPNRDSGEGGQANRFSSRQNVNDAIIAAIKWSNDSSNNNNHSKQQQQSTAKKAKHTQQVRIPESASMVLISHPEPFTAPLLHTPLALLPRSIEVLSPINLNPSRTPTSSDCSTARATERCKSCPISITISLPFPISFPPAALAPPPLPPPFLFRLSLFLLVLFFLYLPVGFHFQLASASATTSSLAFCASLPAHSLPPPSLSFSLFTPSLAIFRYQMMPQFQFSGFGRHRNHHRHIA